MVNPERVRQLPNPFRVQNNYCDCIPRVVAALQPWAEISERLRRIQTAEFLVNQQLTLDCGDLCVNHDGPILDERLRPAFDSIAE